jgi:hypothetical protein
MKTFQMLPTRMLQPIVSVVGAAIAVFLLWLPSASPIVWAAYLVLGAGYVTAQVALSPQQWRSRSGSLAPAKGLVAFIWFAALAGLAFAIGHRP